LADERLPIVFKPSGRQNLAGAALGAAIFAYGFWHAAGGVTGSVRVFHYGSVPAWVAGVVFLAVGALIVAGALVSDVGGCPTLTIGETGIDLSPCRGRPVHVPWQDFAGIRKVRLPTPDPGQFSGVDMIFVATKGGKTINVGPAGDASAIDAAIRRVAERMNVELQEM
jgi:hypothetical protein